jgi:hypothetical protein
VVPADEPIDYYYSKNSLDYFTSLGKDTSYKSVQYHRSSFPDQKYYGAAFEILALAINSAFSPQNPWLPIRLSISIRIAESFPVNGFQKLVQIPQLHKVEIKPNHSTVIIGWQWNFFFRGVSFYKNSQILTIKRTGLRPIPPLQ